MQGRNCEYEYIMLQRAEGSEEVGRGSYYQYVSFSSSEPMDDKEVHL